MMINPYFIIILPIIAAILSYLFPFKKIRMLILLLNILLFLISIYNLFIIRSIDKKYFVIPNENTAYGIILKYDNISCVMVLLTTFIFLSLVIYNYKKVYMQGLFLFLFIVLESLIIAIFLSNDLFTIYVLLEVSTVVASLLIMYKKDSESVYDGMLYFMVNIAAMTFYLLGLGFIYKIFGTLDITSIQDKMILISDKNSVILPFSLIMTALSLKATVIPIFSWLPRAYVSKSSPTSVSAILSALYIKVGLFLFIQFELLFSLVIDASDFFIIIGIITAIAGFIMALSQKDIKLLLAYSTFSQIGLILVGISIKDMYSYYGAMYHIINHALFKTTLFLASGVIENEYKTRDITKIKGLFKKMPFLSAAMTLSILGITGAPLFNASLSKYLIQHSAKNTIVEYAILLINLGTILVFIKFIQMFRGDFEKKISSPPLNIKTILFVLGLLSFFGGIMGQRFLHLLFNERFYISNELYIQKALIYIVSLFLGYIIYHFLMKKSLLLTKIRQTDISFNNIILSVGLFFVTLLGFLRFLN